MKRKLLSMLLALVLLGAVLGGVSADGSGRFVADLSGLLTEDQVRSLETKAAELYQKYDFPLYILTLPDHRSYADTEDLDRAASQIYRSNDLGEGSDHSGILLLMSTDQRGFALRTFGYGNTVYTDYGMDLLFDRIRAHFSQDDWCGGMETYLSFSEELLQLAEEGHPLDRGRNPTERWLGVAACVVLGLLTAVLVRSLLMRQLRSVAVQTDAAAFVAAEGLRLTRKTDRYTHTTRSRVYDPPKQESSSTGGTSVGSDGGSGRSGSY